MSTRARCSAASCCAPSTDPNLSGTTGRGRDHRRPIRRALARRTTSPLSIPLLESEPLRSSLCDPPTLSDAAHKEPLSVRRVVALLSPSAPEWVSHRELIPAQSSLHNLRGNRLTPRRLTRPRCSGHLTAQGLMLRLLVRLRRPCARGSHRLQPRYVRRGPGRLASQFVNRVGRRT